MIEYAIKAYISQSSHLHIYHHNFNYHINAVELYYEGNTTQLNSTELNLLFVDCQPALKSMDIRFTRKGSDLHSSPDR
jgi:hypothetical protein